MFSFLRYHGLADPGDDQRIWTFLVELLKRANGIYYLTRILLFWLNVIFRINRTTFVICELYFLKFTYIFTLYFFVLFGQDTYICGLVGIKWYKIILFVTYTRRSHFVSEIRKSVIITGSLRHKFCNYADVETILFLETEFLNVPLLEKETQKRE